jgi:DNA-binding NarL/FixJ family response regulator
MQINNPQQQEPHESLSQREFQTLMMIASGQTVSEIAGKLSLSVKTISMYRVRLLQKMQLRHNTDLTQYAIRNNLEATFKV